MSPNYLATQCLKHVDRPHSFCIQASWRLLTLV
jgi:hypothetical protein